LNLNPNQWLKDRRGDWSFTRIAPLFCLLMALYVWAAGIYYPLYQAYCQQMVDKLIDFAKWAFCIGKTMEEGSAALALKGKENVQSYSSKVETTTTLPTPGKSDDASQA
jgi:hypothetical protein